MENVGETGVLSGIRTLDFASLLAGPIAAQLLGDLGADVIKIEHPVGGDAARIIAGGGKEPDPPLFLAANRNKRSLALDLFHPRAGEVLVPLLESADVVIQNFRASVARRCGLDAGAVRARRADVVHCSLSAFGFRGPGRDRPGTDALIQGTSGLMWLSGDEGDDPVRSGFAPVDMIAAHQAAYAILAALLHRQRCGEGQDIHVSLLGSALALQAPRLQEYLSDGEAPRRAGRSSVFAEPATHFRTADGWINIVAINDKYFRRLCAGLEMPELASDSRFAAASDRITHRELLHEALRVRLGQKRTAEWLQILVPLDVPCGPIQDCAAVTADADARAEELFTTVEHQRFGSVQLTAAGPHLSVTPASIRRGPPTVGQHSREILAELGLPEPLVTELAEARCIATHPCSAT